ncbi:MAG TPA: 16S rRNA (cytidine(1402)-2'-O)-methyltransferase [Acidobacteriaceae bacterium]|jgi:16S rRNA (cytidine1402-2'-O)-methyltransferase|nr:16S rRNA (cytidine(1402)-2'-O)-methyltransferase [Acidobacteriaceae bacterium]
MSEGDPPLAPGLYLVATPIGNLEDITLRALRVLRTADRIACEDTRQTRKLLDRYGITTPTISSHEHNEGERSLQLVEELKAGARIAVVSDAGTPGISDPGMVLAGAAIAVGIPVFPVPGANAALAALVGSGLDTENFIFLGFLPPKAGARRTALEAAAAAVARPTTLILYEAPHRILETLGDVEAVWGAGCRVALARELTKIHEEFLRGTAADVRRTLAERESQRGEMALLVAAEPLSAESSTSSIVQRLEELHQSEGLDERDGLKRIAKERGVAKSELWRELQRERARGK